MNSKTENWDDKAKKRSDVCSSIRGGIHFVVKESNRVSNILGLGDEKVILDVCCGDGGITNRLASFVQKTVGIDRSLELLAMGEKCAKDMGLANVDYINSEASRLPFADDSFDLTISLSAFHYFPDYDYAGEVVRELIRVTKFTGKILITEVPSKDTVWYGIWELIRNRDRDKKPVDFIEFEKMNRFERVLARTHLLLRRFTGKRVDSDDWSWYEKGFFEVFQGDKFKEVKIFPSSQKRVSNYRFDVLFSNNETINDRLRDVAQKSSYN